MTLNIDEVDYIQNIKNSRLSIYDVIEVGDPRLWIPTETLQNILNEALSGIFLGEIPPRTRSKVVKELVCQALGYPIPGSFKKTKPRFIGQQFDTYVQQRNNVQIWNEDIPPARRYVLIRVSPEFVISNVKVVLGSQLSILDTTGKLTKKYQARCIVGELRSELLSARDTSRLEGNCNSQHSIDPSKSPVSGPVHGQLIPINFVYEKLRLLVGQTFPDAGPSQDRNRGEGLHRLVCKALGYSGYQDNGQFPDILNQLIEVKLQTSPTIDLGLALPSDTAVLDVGLMQGEQIRHCDIRYAIFYGETDGKTVTLTHFFLTTGERFFERFPQCEGLKQSKKLQIHLPSDFFDANA